MSTVDDQYFSINSAQRTGNSASSTDFTISLPTVISGNRVISIKNLVLPNTFQTITITTGNNDRLDFDAGSGVQTVTVPAGTYSVAALALELKTLMDAATPTTSYTVSITAAGVTTITQNVPTGAQMFTVIAAGVSQNNLIDFNAGSGVQTATIPAGTYSRTALASAVTLAMNNPTIGPISAIPFTVAITTANKTTISQIPSSAQQTFAVINAGSTQNNLIDFQIQGDIKRVATIPGAASPGLVYTRAGLVAAIQNALNTSASTLNFTVSMSTANKTTIAFQAASSQQMFIVTVGNNSIDVDAGNGQQTASIPVGTYTRTALAAAVAAALNALIPTTAGFTTTISTANKTTIARNIPSNTAPNISLLFASGVHSGATCAAKIGFTKADISTSPFVSDLTVPNVGTVIDGTNDQFDFNDGLAKFVTLTHGGAVLPATIATDLQTKLRAISESWTVTYTVGTLKFTLTHTITTATGAFNMLLGTASNPQSPFASIGFANADLSGGDFYVGTTQVTLNQTITAGVNDTIIFTAYGTSGSQKTVTIPAATYTPANLATTIQGLLNGISCCFAVLYDTDTALFTIARLTSTSLNAFSLLWGTGSHATSTSAAGLLGFSPSNLTGASTYTGDLNGTTQTFDLLFGTGPNTTKSADNLLGYSNADFVGQTSYTSDLTAIPIATTFSLLFNSGPNATKSADALLGFSNIDLSGANTYTGDLTAMFTNIFSLLFGTGPSVGRSIGPTLGFSVTDLTGSTTYSSQLHVIYTPNRVFIQCGTLGINTRQTTDGTNFAWEIPVTVGLGSIVTAFIDAPPLSIVGKGPFPAISIKLVQSDGAVIALGPIDWKFSVLIESP